MQVRHSDKVRKNAFLDLLEAEQTIVAPCRHFTEGCGGCLMQDRDYAAQVRAKEGYLNGIYRQPVAVHPCPDPFGYRNRMDFVQAFGKSGLRQRGRYAQVVDVGACMLLPDAGRDLYRNVRELAIAHNIPDYNYIRHEGFLKYIVIRMGRTTGQAMVILTTVTPDEAQERAFREFMDAVYAALSPTSLWWTVVKGKADMSVGEPYHHLGSAHIIDEIAGSRFAVAPGTFFQANTIMAGTLFREAAKHASGTVLDLYCGVGVISAIIAPSVEKVIGVELNPASIVTARENAALNSIANAEFHAADATQWLAANTTRFDTVICDPARPGLGKAACALLLAMAPQRIIYISCNPVTHQDDLDILMRDYDLVELAGYDLFPQTPHIEVLSVLQRKI